MHSVGMIDQIDRIIDDQDAVIVTAYLDQVVSLLFK